MRGQVFFLLAGLLPLGMLFQFWTRSGTGIHLLLFGFMFLLASSFLIALNHFSFYRQYKPRSALVPPGPFIAFCVAGALFVMGFFNMAALPHGLSLQLSPGPKIETAKVIPTAAKMFVTKPGKMKLPKAKALDIKTPKQRWMLSFPYMGGGLWGALGYALAFGFAGALFGLLRREIVDPRDEHIGSGMMGALSRAGVGLFYGSAMGFLAGGAIITVLRTVFPTLPPSTPAQFLHWIYALGAATHPNTAFSYAFTTACFMAGAMALFLGRRDFTAAVSDPKAPELTRPVQVLIPEVPPPPQMAFDMNRVQMESQQILSQFGGELSRMFKGSEWEYERYDVPVIGRGKQANPEVEATNLISARTGEDDDYETAMGPLSNVYVQITAELGTLELSAADWLTMGEGAMLELPKNPDGTIGIRINGKPAGKGKALTVNGYKAVKMTTMKSTVEQLVQR